jgi:hypothetical protein
MPQPALLDTTARDRLQPLKEMSDGQASAFF